MANTEQNPQKYTLTAEVEFSITGTSIMDAYKEFTKWMAKAFEESFTGPPDPDTGFVEPVIVPSSFEGMAIVRDFDGE